MRDDICSERQTTTPGRRVRLGAIDFLGWLGQAQPGDTIEYHRGFLALDTIRDGSRLPEKERAELSGVARRAWWASQAGLVHLVQRRHGRDDYSYFAIARAKHTQTSSASLRSILLEEAA